MSIPGELIALATFPGVVIHELAHQLFCRLSRVAIFDVCYFRCENPVGYVRHEVPRTALHHASIALGPFMINSVLGAAIAFPSAIPAMEFSAGSSSPVIKSDFLGLGAVVSPACGE